MSGWLLGLLNVFVRVGLASVFGWLGLTVLHAVYPYFHPVSFVVVLVGVIYALVFWTALNVEIVSVERDVPSRPPR